MIVPLRYSIRAKAILTALFLLAALFCPAARGADKDKKPEKEKKEKIEPWVEIRTAHFIVASDGGEKTARRIADEFESLLRVFQATMPNSRISTGVPVRILAARDGQSFARMAPEFPFDKRHDQPPGMFVSGPEKTYIGIRANAAGHFPYIEIFQNYAREILKLSPDSKIVFVSQESNPDVVQEAFNLGARGYVAKTRAASDLLAAADAVLEGGRFVSSGLTGCGPD